MDNRILLYQCVDKIAVLEIILGGIEFCFKSERDCAGWPKLRKTIVYILFYFIFINIEMFTKGKPEADQLQRNSKYSANAIAKKCEPVARIRDCNVVASYLCKDRHSYSYCYLFPLVYRKRAGWGLDSDVVKSENLWPWLFVLLTTL